MSWVGIPSVMHTQYEMPASAASMMASAANGGGTNTIDAVAPVSCVASFMVSKTGRSRHRWPPRPGVTPPTTWVP